MAGSEEALEVQLSRSCAQDQPLACNQASLLFQWNSWQGWENRLMISCFF